MAMLLYSSIAGTEIEIGHPNVLARIRTRGKSCSGGLLDDGLDDVLVWDVFFHLLSSEEWRMETTVPVLGCFPRPLPPQSIVPIYFSQKQ